MQDSTEAPTAGEVGELCAQLRDLSGRYARFEDVPSAEVDAYMARNMARKRDVLGRIDPETLL